MVDVNTTFALLPQATGITGAEVIPLDQGGTTKQATLTQAIGGALTTGFNAAAEYVIDGNGAAATIGMKGYLEMPFAARVVQVDLYGDSTPGGACQVDIWRCSYSQFDAGVTHPVVADSIFGGINLPSISAGATKGTVSYSSGIQLNAGDVLGFNLNSVSGFNRITISAKLTRSFTGASS